MSNIVIQKNFRNIQKYIYLNFFQNFLRQFNSEFLNYLGALLILFEEFKMNYVQLYSTHSKYRKLANSREN